MQNSKDIDLLLTRYTMRTFLSRTVHQADPVKREGNKIFIGIQLKITPQWQDDYDTVLPILEGKSLFLPEWCTEQSKSPDEYQYAIAERLGAVTPEQYGLVSKCLRKAVQLVKETFYYKNPDASYIHWFDETLHSEITQCAGRFMAAFHRCRVSLQIPTLDLLKVIKDEVACFDYTEIADTAVIVINDGYITYSTLPNNFPEKENIVGAFCKDLHNSETFKPIHLLRHSIGPNRRYKTQRAMESASV
jgi:hypothetical protein